MSAGKMFCTKQKIIYWHSKKLYLESVQKHITDYPVDQKQYLNNFALRTLRYSWRLSTASTTLLFTESVNSTNITVHIPQCVTVMNRDTLQRFPPGSTSTPLSHTRLHLADSLVWLKGRSWSETLIHLYIYIYIYIYIHIYIYFLT